MALYCNVFVAETVAEVVAKLQQSGVYVDYTPKPEDPEYANGYIERNGGTISSCIRWRENGNLADLLRDVPLANACLQIPDNAVNFGYVLHKAYELFTVLKAPDYDLKSMSSENPKPNIQEVIDLLGTMQVAIGLFGCTVEGAATLDSHTAAIGQAICSELGVSPEEALSFPALTPLPPQAEQKFLELRDWLRGHSNVRW